MILSRIGSLDVYTFGIYEAHPDVSCIATTRAGGVSQEAFATFNLGQRCGDDPEHVRENRARLARALEVAPERLTAGGQVHGAAIATVTAGAVGSGGMDPANAIPGTDGLVTNVPDVPLLELVADCVAIYLYDPVTRAIGIAHGGWRGTAAGVAGAAVVRMKEAFGSMPADMVAAIGPSIGPCCYDVGADVVERFHAVQPDIARHVFSDAVEPATANAGKMRLDLWEANRLILVGAGVDAHKIEVGGFCTACHPELFYSHRASRGHTGRSAGVIVLRGRSRCAD